MASLDTNILVRWIIRDSPDQLQKIAARLAGDEVLYISPVAISELEHVLDKVYGLPRQLIVRHLETLANNSRFKVAQSVLLQTLALYGNHPALSFIDCWLASEAAVSNETPLYTFDQKLARQSPAAVQC